MVKEVTPREWGELLEVWESAVRATHDFISEEDLQFYKKAIPERYLPELCVYCLRNEAGRMLGFLGVSASEIEMLFVRDEARGRGVGRELLEYATGVLGLTRLWVNSITGRPPAFTAGWDSARPGVASGIRKGNPIRCCGWNCPGGGKRAGGR